MPRVQNPITDCHTHKKGFLYPEVLFGVPWFYRLGISQWLFSMLSLSVGFTRKEKWPHLFVVNSILFPSFAPLQKKTETRKSSKIGPGMGRNMTALGLTHNFLHRRKQPMGGSGTPRMTTNKDGRPPSRPPSGPPSEPPSRPPSFLLLSHCLQNCFPATESS
jgi:hypothetical protein